MIDRPLFSVVVATLVRPSYPSLVASLRRQTFRDFELLARADSGPDVNEYVARTRAARTAHGEILVFLDDDATARPDHLARLERTFRERPDLVAVSGPIFGNMLGRGNELVDHDGWWIGANLAARRDVFLERPFEEDWGLGRVPRGWRADSDWGFSIEERYPGRWFHDSGLIVDHPRQMQSQWDPEVEAVFFKRWRAQYIDRFVPVDPRGTQFLLQTQSLTPEERAKVIRARQEMRKSMPQIPVLPQEV